MEEFLAATGSIITLVSIYVSIHIYNKNQRLQRELKTFSWERVHAASATLGKLIRAKFKPDLILTYTPRSGMIALLCRETIGEDTPLFVGTVFHKPTPAGFNPTGYTKIETAKMDVFLPDAAVANKDARVLVVDEYVITGDSLAIVIKYLTDAGLQRENIVTAALISTESARISRKAPDFYSYCVDSSDFFMPWGKAQ